MITFIKTCFFTFTLWVTAACINGALFAIIFSLGELVQEGFVESFGTVTFFSMVFSGPAIFVLWLVFISNTSEADLSARLLRTAFILSLISCLFVGILPENVYGGHWLLLSFIIVLSSILSVLLHHPVIHSFKKDQHV